MSGSAAHRMFRVLTLAALAITLFAPAVPASIVGSGHDFADKPVGNGSGCEACHKVHGWLQTDPDLPLVNGALLWPRDLTEEDNFFDQDNQPNYVPSTTLLCYDCHDNQTVADVDDDPDPTTNWTNSFHGNGEPGTPQDIAFTDGPPPGTAVGYYELFDASIPSGSPGGGPTDGSPTGGHFWQSSPNPTGLPVYEQGDKLSCEMCHDPHNSATRVGSNDAMFRLATPDGMGGIVAIGDNSGYVSSTNTRAHATDTPTQSNGRNMCAACHSYADGSGGEPGIPANPVRLWDVDLPRPPGTLPDHNAGGQVACTNCHKHNRIVARCDDCHGYPPTVNSPWSPANRDGEHIPGSSGAHMAHLKGVGRNAADPDLYFFGCLAGTCHPGGSTHMQDLNGDDDPPNEIYNISRNEIEVDFNSPGNPAGDDWNPNGVFNPGASPAVATCSQLYCHSNGLVENGHPGKGDDDGTNQNGSSGLGEYAENGGQAAFYGASQAVSIQWGQTFAGLFPGSSNDEHCWGCHGKGDVTGSGLGTPKYFLEVGGTPVANINDTVVPVPGYLNADTETFTENPSLDNFKTTGANTHFIHTYKINADDGTYGMWGAGVRGDDINTGCGCHPVRLQRYDDGDPDTGNPSYHVDRRINIGDSAAIDDTGAANSVGRGCANNCHNGASPPDWGENLAAAPVANDSCVFVCHGLGNAASGTFYGASPGGRITKDPGSAGSRDAQPKYMQTGHGLSSASTYGSGSAGADMDCDQCHLLDDRGATPATRSYHYERVPQATGNAAAPLAGNPYWLDAPYEADPDGLCETCHDPATLTDPHNHTAQSMITFLGYDPKYDTATPGTWDTFTPNCVNCHDPHGEPNWFMLYDGDAEKTADDSSDTYSGPVIYDGSRFGVTIAQANASGFPPGPPYAPTQTAVTMTDNTNGSDYAVGDGSGICEVCHTQTIYYNNSGTGGVHLSTLCSDCHKHPEGFAPSGCEGCHGCPTNPGLDGIAGNADDAPNVMGDGTSSNGVGGVPKFCDDGTWGYNVNGHGANGTAPNTPSGLNPNSDCPDCHDISDPPGAHFNGIVESVFNGVRNANTAHLNANYIVAAPANEWDVQVNFDNECWTQCHSTSGVVNHHHRALKDTPPPPVEAVQFGTHLTMADGDAINPPLPQPEPSTGPWPIDTDISTNATAAQPHFAVCASCHDPHGTNVNEPSRITNRMVRDQWITQPTGGLFCKACHQ